jgi:hypothetical protein
MSDQQLNLFRECVKEYVDITNQIAEASKGIKAVRQKKEELGEIIHEFMAKNNYEVAASGDVKLILKKSTKMPGLKEDNIMTVLRDMYGGDDAAKIWRKITESRESQATVVDKLSCRKNRTSK